MPEPNSARSREPRVDVVILTWNDQEEMLAAAKSAQVSHGVETRVLVVDNGSDEPALPPVGCELIVSDVNLGVGGGRNLGAESVNAPVVAFLDSDARLASDALAQLVAGLGHDVAITAPVFTGYSPAFSGGQRPTMIRKLARAVGLTDQYARASGEGDWSDSWEVDFVIGACMLVRTDVFRSLGGFDDSDLFGPEDLQFCDRVRAAGWEIRQVAAAHCEHDARRGHRRVLSRRGLRHARAVARYYWRRGRDAP